VGKEKGNQYPVTLENVSAAEPGIKAVVGARALYRDVKGTPAVVFSQHGKGTSIYLNADITNYQRWRLQPLEGESLRHLIAGLLKSANVPGQYTIAQSDGQEVTGVEVHPWQCGSLRILGIHRNYDLMVSELGPADYQKQSALKRPLELKIHFDRELALRHSPGDLPGEEKNSSLPIKRDSTYDPSHPPRTCKGPSN
jgi:hypothetical protein